MKNKLQQALNSGTASPDQLLLVSMLNEKKVNELADKIEAQTPQDEFTEDDENRILAKVKAACTK